MKSWLSMFCACNLFLLCLNILQIRILFCVSFSSLNNCASPHPRFSCQSLIIISTKIKSDKDTQIFTIRINRVVRFLQTVHDSSHVAKSTLRKQYKQGQICRHLKFYKTSTKSQNWWKHVRVHYIKVNTNTTYKYYK